MVLGSNVQVVWEKFCRYWDVEPRYVPMAHGRYVVDPDDVMARVDENTIGVDRRSSARRSPASSSRSRRSTTASSRTTPTTGFDVPLHVDAASGGFVAPFLHPHLEWDFRLPQVKSINVSGHKYGLTYPGVGFVVWRSTDDLPEDLVFHVNYLGGDMPTFTLNFSRPGNQIVGQYYNFVRLGAAGYTPDHGDAARHRRAPRRARSRRSDRSSVISDGSAIPVLAFTVQGRAPYTVSTSPTSSATSGWQVPAYTMPDDATDVAVLRIVVREGFSMRPRRRPARGSCRHGRLPAGAPRGLRPRGRRFQPYVRLG